MAFNYSPKIVTDGLIAYFDAANPKSIVSGSSATIWRDLSKNQYHATNFNSYLFANEYGGGIRLDGVNQYFSYTAPLTRALSVFTICRSNQSTWSNSGVMSSARITNGFIQHPQQNQSNTRSYIATSYIEITPSLTPTDIQLPQFSAITTNGINRHTHYLNSTNASISTADTTNTRSDTPTSGNVYLGRDSTLVRYGNMTIYVHLLYNRELSEFEVYQNLNALKGRFGI